MKKLFYIKSIVFITIVACLIFFMSYTARHIEQEAVKAEEGYVDLTDFDFDEKLAYLNTGFDYYREILYDPYDFEAGNLSKPVITNEKKGRFNPGDYGTYRMIVRLNKGVTYGISSYSAMYSQRLFINKSEYEQIGKVGVTKEETVAKTKHYTYYFTPTEDVTEIVIQFSNNVHSDYGGIVALYLGSQDVIQARDAVMQQRTNIIAGCLITAFLFFVGMFIYFGSKSFLWFSMISLSIAVRTLSVKEKVIMLLIPEMPWEMAIGVEYISLILLVFSFLMYVRNMFPNYVNKIVMSVFGALSALYAIVVILSYPAIYTKYLLIYQIVSALFSLYIIASLFYYLIIKKEKCLPEHLLVFMSLSFFVLMAILEIRIHRISGFKFATGLTEVGMIVMIFVNMIALSMRFSRTKSELDKAQKNELQMQETNQLLDRMMRLKSDFLANISHEMRTPLTVMSSFAGLTTMQIKNDKTNDKTIENLNTIVSEAKRLSDLIEQIKHISEGKQRQFSITNSDIVAMLKRTADFCKPICDKNNNTIKIENRADRILLNINEEGIFQTLLNLVVNANRHTSEGVIKLSASEDEKEAGFIKITVSDDGKGIDDKLLPHLFERGVSGSGDSGLGLAISREIIEEHGGRIWAESKKGYGTDVSFILPYDKSER